MSEITKSIEFICEEKGLEAAIVMEAVEAALAAAYRKDFGNRQQNIEVKFDAETGDIQAWDVKLVVEDIAEDELEKAQEELSARREQARTEGRELTDEETEDLVRFNPKTELMITEAKEVKKDAELGETLRIMLEVPGDFGRMAAQTAKQVIIQKIREAERNSVFEDFKDQEGQVVQGTVQRRDRSGNIIIDLGRITGIVPEGEQIARESYRPGIKLPFYVKSVEMGQRGPQIILSRSTNTMVETVFEAEIPEIQDGIVVIKGIARDAGNRSKVSVSTDDDSIDPIGSCIGQRGSRITTIIDELGGEKIDIIQYSENPIEYITQALSPAKIVRVEVDEEKKEAIAYVEQDQFSLAIGRGGQNVRLASDLTGLKIDVVQEGGEPSEDSEETSDEKATEAPAEAADESAEVSSEEPNTEDEKSDNEAEKTE